MSEKSTVRTIKPNALTPAPEKKEVQAIPVDLGQNIDAVIEGDMLILKIDLSKRGGTSASGKSVIVATSAGNQKVGQTGVTIGINAYVPAK